MKGISPTAGRVMLGLALGAMLFGLGTKPASAQTTVARFAVDQNVIDAWSQIKAPAIPPELKPFQATPDTALLLLDFVGAQDPSKGPCNAPKNPRCIASIAKVKPLLDQARAKGMLVVWSMFSKTAPTTDIATSLAPGPNDPVVRAPADKFVGTDLDKILAARNIKTLIVTGTIAEGAVLNTASDAVFRGNYNIVLPVDTMSSPDIYAEQYVAWHMTHGPSVAAKTTLTRSDMIKF